MKKKLENYLMKLFMVKSIIVKAFNVGHTYKIGTLSH